MTRIVISLAALLALATTLSAQPAAAQDTASTRAQILAELEAECDALLAERDGRAVECTTALRDARRASSPVVVARIRRQYADDPLEATEAAAREVDARDAYDLFDEDDADVAWAAYGE